MLDALLLKTWLNLCDNIQVDLRNLEIVCHWEQNVCDNNEQGLCVEKSSSTKTHSECDNVKQTLCSANNMCVCMTMHVEFTMQIVCATCTQDGWCEGHALPIMGDKIRWPCVQIGLFCHTCWVTLTKINGWQCDHIVFFMQIWVMKRSKFQMDAGCA